MLPLGNPLRESKLPMIRLLLLAAGHSRRFKALHNVHKLCHVLPPFERPILTVTHQAALKSFYADEILIVVNQEEADVIALAQTLGSPIQIIESDGIGESIRQGIQALPSNTTGILILPADLPYIQPVTLTKVKNALTKYPIARPIHQGQAGHPVGFDQSLFPELKQLTGDQGASALVKAHTCHLIDTDDFGAIYDIDHPNDLLCL